MGCSLGWYYQCNDLFCRKKRNAGMLAPLTKINASSSVPHSAMVI